MRASANRRIGAPPHRAGAQHRDPAGHGDHGRRWGPSLRQGVNICAGASAVLGSSRPSCKKSRNIVRQQATYPLQNWSPMWKGLCITAASLVSFTQGFGPLSLAPTFPILAEEFDSTLPAVVRFTGVAILVLGFSNFIW